MRFLQYRFANLIDKTIYLLLLHAQLGKPRAGVRWCALRD